MMWCYSFNNLNLLFDLKIRIKKEKVGDAVLDHYDMTIAFLLYIFPVKLEMETMYKIVYIRLAIMSVNTSIITIVVVAPNKSLFIVIIIKSNYIPTSSPPK